MAEKFVQLIENYECLYNTTLQEYSRKDATEKAWAEISRCMDWTVADCKEKWKNIRNGFVRSLKPSPSGSSSKARKQYYLHDVMQFVLPYVKPIQHLENTGNIVQTDISNEAIIQSDEDVCEPSTNDSQTNTEHHSNEILERQEKRRQEAKSLDKKSGKRKVRKEKDDVDIAVLQYVSDKKENKKSLDDKQMFLLSLLPDVSKLSERNLRQFKIKTLTLLEDMLTQQEQGTVISHAQATMEPSTWSASTSRASYTSFPGPSASSSSTSPQYTPNHHAYELTTLQNMSQQF